MTVYVESNFVVEIALLQEEAIYARDILSLAEEGRLSLRVPSFSLCEPFTTLTRRRLEREQVARSIDQELRQLSRSPLHADDHRRLRHVPSILTDIGVTQADELDQAIQDLLRVAGRIELDAGIFDAALRYREAFGFTTTQDAIVFASVVADLRASPPAAAAAVRCFVTRNRRDFEDNPRVRGELAGLGCTVMTKFEAAAGYLRSRLRPGV